MIDAGHIDHFCRAFQTERCRRGPWYFIVAYPGAVLAWTPPDPRGPESGMNLSGLVSQASCGPPQFRATLGALRHWCRIEDRYRVLLPVQPQAQLVGALPVLPGSEWRWPTGQPLCFDLHLLNCILRPLTLPDETGVEVRAEVDRPSLMLTGDGMLTGNVWFVGIAPLVSSVKPTCEPFAGLEAP